MENNSQPPAPAAPAKVTPPANESPKTTQASSNQEVVPMAARTAATDGSAAQPQRGTAIGSVPVGSMQQHPQSSTTSLLQVVQRQLEQGSSSNAAVVTTAGTDTGVMYCTSAQRGAAAMPRSPTAVRSLAYRPVQQTNPVVFGQGSSSSNQAMQSSSSTQAAAMTALAAATFGPTGGQYGAAMPWWLPPPATLLPAPMTVRPTKLMIVRPPSPPPPKLPVYRPPPPPGFCVSNMQADLPSPDQVTVPEEGSDSEGGGGRGDDVEMLDLNFPPVSDNKEN